MDLQAQQTKLSADDQSVRTISHHFLSQCVALKRSSTYDETTSPNQHAQLAESKHALDTTLYPCNVSATPVYIINEGDYLIHYVLYIDLL